MTDLERKIQQADEAYYNTGNPIMSDQEYDTLRAKLNSQKVGTAPSGKLPQVKHDHLMLSLDKVHSVEEVLKFGGADHLIGMLKMDGLTVSASYKDGQLVKLETRGNGEVGNDIMIHADSFINLPRRIPQSVFFPDVHSLTVDGECIITYEDFNKINAELQPKDQFANPRNLAAGTLNNLDPSVSKKRRLRFVAWDVIECNGGVLSPTMWRDFQFLLDFGFTVVPCVDFLSPEDDIEKLKRMAEEESYPIDGLVFSYMDNNKRRSADRTAHHFKHSVAYKFEDETYPTTLCDIEWTMGKTGALTPVAIFDPVVIDGTEVSKASMHNVSVMRDLNPHINGTVYVYKANAIIPQLHHCDDDGDEFEIPDTCPICGEDTRLVKENESAVLMCSNPHCPGKLLGKMVTFASKNAMNIDGLSTEKLRLLLERRYVKGFPDIYHLKQYRAKLSSQVSGWGKKSVDNLLKSIDRSRHVRLENFITALSLPNIGYTQAKAIAKYCKTINEFISCISTPEKLLSIEGIGAKTVSDIRGWTKSGTNMEELMSLTQYLVFEDSSFETADGSLTGKIFCITGTLHNFANRAALIKDIESHGGKYVDTVSKKITHLINNDSQSETKKNMNARKFGVKIITEDEYLELISSEK